MQTRVAEMLGMEFPVGSFGPSRDAPAVVHPVAAVLRCSVIGDPEVRSGQSVAQCDSTTCDGITDTSGLLGEAVER
jgi:hypothetical protein